MAADIHGGRTTSESTRILPGTATVSVVIPVYNRSTLLKRAVESVLRQTLPADEILIVDDASDEEYRSDIDALEGGKVKVIRLPQNKGAAGARNTGFLATTCDYIALLDSDDYWLPEKLERQMAALLRSGEAFSTTAYWISRTNQSPNDNMELRTPNDIRDIRDLVWGCGISPGSTALFRRSLLEEVGLQDETLWRLEDWDWMLRVSDATPVSVLSEPLSVIDVLGKPSARQVRKSTARLLKINFPKIMKRRFDLGCKLLSAVLVENAAANYSDGNSMRALTSGVGAILVWPFRNMAFYRRVLGALASRRHEPEWKPRPQKHRQHRILHLISSLESGGAERMLTNIVLQDVHHASPDSMEHLVVTLLPGGRYVPDLEACSISVSTLNLMRARDIPRAIFALCRKIREWQPDTIKCWMYYANLLGLLARMISLPAHRPKLLWGIRCSNMDLEKYSRTLKIVVRLGAILSPMVDGIIINNYAGLRHHRFLGFANKNWYILNNGVDIDQFKPIDAETRAERRRELCIADDVILVGTSARNDIMKGYDVLFKALENVPMVQCVGAGSGTHKLKGPDNFKGLGDVGNVSTLLGSLDIFVLASRFGEGFSNALTEAMAAGCAAIATDVGDNARILGDAGIVVEPEDPAALAAAIKYLAENPEERARLGRLARERIKTNFTTETSMATLRRIIQEEPSALQVLPPRQAE